MHVPGAMPRLHPDMPASVSGSRSFVLDALAPVSSPNDARSDPRHAEVECALLQFSPQQVVRMGAMWDTYRAPCWSRTDTRPSALAPVPAPAGKPTPAPIVSQGQVGSLGGTQARLPAAHC